MKLYINGNKIGDQVLAPAPTDYRTNCLYNTFDVTAEIKRGNNAVATVLEVTAAFYHASKLQTGKDQHLDGLNVAATGDWICRRHIQKPL